MAPANVRLAETTADLQAFRDLVVEYERSLPEDLRHAGFETELQDLQQYYGWPHAALIASLDEAAAGCVAMSALGASTAVMKKMYVRPVFRGQGVARALAATLIQLARDRGYARIVLDTDRERLAAAYTLYRSLGFEESEPYGKVSYRCPTFMQLLLTTAPTP